MQTLFRSRSWQSGEPTTCSVPAIAIAHVIGTRVVQSVQYVKICSLYGVGFYYVPGTDMCIKIGGWVRAEYAWGVNNASTTSFVGDLNNRTTGNTWWRIRG